MTLFHFHAQFFHSFATPIVSGKMDSFLGNFKTRGSRGGGGTQSPPPRSSSATDSMATMATSLTSVGIKSSASGRVTNNAKFPVQDFVVKYQLFLICLEHCALFFEIKIHQLCNMAKTRWKIVL